MKGRDEVTTAKPQTASFENPADAAALQAVEAARAAGQDPFGDMDDDTAAPAPSPAPAPAPAADAAAADEHDDLEDEVVPAEPPAAAPAADVLTPEQIAAAAAPAAPAPPPPAPSPAPAPQQLNFKTRTPAELATAQSALLTKKTDAFQQYSEGTMSPEDYSKIDNEVMQGFASITAEMALQHASQQTAMQSQEQLLDGIKARAVEQGLDYEATPKALEQFNNAIDLLAKDPDMRALSDGEFYEKAHNMVLFMRGIAAGAPAPTPAGAPAAPATPAAAREDMKAPVTLRGVPAASTANAGGGLTEQLSRANGLEFEELVSKIPRSQRDAWMDS